MSEQEVALLASSGAAEAEAEARSEGEVSASGPADTEAVDGGATPWPLQGADRLDLVADPEGRLRFEGAGAL